LDEQRVSADPANGRARLDLSYDLADRGLILLRLGRAAAAVELYRKAEKIRAEMVVADGRDARAATALVSAEWRLGYALMQAGDRGGAAEEFRSAVRTAERMIRELPDKKVGTQALADACWNIALCYTRQRSSCAEAMPWLLRARELFRELNQPAPKVEQSLEACAAAKRPLRTSTSEKSSALKQ
jgi:tetratricopeptide (TPR) repeat protein